MYHRCLFLLCVFLIFFSVRAQDYQRYHNTCREIERLLLEENLEGAMGKYLKLESQYTFIFKKDLKVALQLAYRLGDSPSFERLARLTFSQGWDWKRAKKELKDNPDFAAGMAVQLKTIAKQSQPSQVPHPDVRRRVKQLFIQDQWQALGALFTFSPQRQSRYAEGRIAPDAKKRVLEIWQIVEEIGYPGEMLIGNAVWSSTLFSHYNSISEGFAKKDTLYPAMRGILKAEIWAGRISPFEFALIDNWYQSVSSGRAVESYGILEGAVSESSLITVDRNRVSIGLPDVSTYNELLEWQEKTGIKLFFSHAWGNNAPIKVKK